MGKSQIQNDFSLKYQNSFNIEAFCSFFTELDSESEIVDFVRYDLRKYPCHLVLGGGSNLLFTRDFPGIVIKNAAKGIKIYQQDNENIILGAAAGELWDDLVRFAVDKNFAGIENLSLIPGTVGASPIQNIGAYGVEMKDVFHSLRALNINDGSIETFGFNECRFGYRDSFFKREGKGKYIILEVLFSLNTRNDLRLAYGSITEELRKKGLSGETAGIADVRDAVIAIRRDKLPDPAILGNAGSFFKNPSVDAGFHEHLKVTCPGIVSFAQNNGSFKLAAGWLIEQCGWKGKRIGDAGVHEKQALVLVNYGNANGRNVLDLAENIIASVNQRFNVKLEMEVNIV